MNEPQRVDRTRVEKAVREILVAVGEDPDREGLQETPSRVARAFEEMLSGMHANPKEHLRRQFHVEGQNEMVVVRDIPFASLCEHHMLPFIGHAHVAYIPTYGTVCGLSKIARVIEGYAKRLQVQERLTNQVADAFVEELGVQGVMVVIEAEHTCMTIRGVTKPGSRTVTSALRGTLKSDHRSRDEALGLFGNS